MITPRNSASSASARLALTGHLLVGMIVAALGGTTVLAQESSLAPQVGKIAEVEVEAASELDTSDAAVIASGEVGDGEVGDTDEPLLRFSFDRTPWREVIQLACRRGRVGLARWRSCRPVVLLTRIPEFHASGGDRSSQPVSAAGRLHLGSEWQAAIGHQSGRSPQHATTGCDGRIGQR